MKAEDIGQLKRKYDQASAMAEEMSKADRLLQDLTGCTGALEQIPMKGIAELCGLAAISQSLATLVKARRQEAEAVLDGIDLGKV